MREDSINLKEHKTLKISYFSLKVCLILRKMIQVQNVIHVIQWVMRNLKSHDVIRTDTM